MKLFLACILFFIFSSNIYTQTKKILSLRKIDNILIGITSLDSLPKVFVDNSVDLQAFTAMIQEKLPELSICNSEQCRTELVLVYNVFHDRHNIIYGTIEVDCRRWATVTETGNSGFFSVWTGIKSFLFSENNTRDIKDVIHKYVNSIMDDFSADYKKENQD
jgi:hypothetical protein